MRGRLIDGILAIVFLAVRSVAEECPAGKYGNPALNIGCEFCPVGKYMHQTGQAVCLDCPAGRYQLGAIRKTSGKCEHYFDSLSKCNEAAVALDLDDTSAVKDNQDGVSYDPKGCYYEGGALKWNEKMTNDGDCSSNDVCLCNDGVGLMQCDLCPKGSYCPDATSKILCPAGKYGNRTGQTA